MFLLYLYSNNQLQKIFIHSRPAERIRSYWASNHNIKISIMQYQIIIEISK